jgi:hypothetical protein
VFVWNLLFGLLILGTVRYGDYITRECPQKRYSCPEICDVDHIHLPIKECKDAKSRKEKVQLYKERQTGCKEVRQEDWEESSEKEEVLIRGYKNAETEQESRPDSTIIPSGR